jgi:hypothetical protein
VLHDNFLGFQIHYDDPVFAVTDEVAFSYTEFKVEKAFVLLGVRADVVNFFVIFAFYFGENIENVVFDV